jgi:UDP-N-acetylglucosamine 2-epimerase (non-hydrolysing)
VSGSHFSTEHGNTYKDLGFVRISKYLNLDVESVQHSSPHVFSTALLKSHEYLTEERPEFVIILGDRYEILAVALAAYFLRIPIVHLHGGEVTLGAQDEAFRHAVTKLSHIHLTANAEFKDRVIQMGEDPSCVYNVGALGIDNISTTALLPVTETKKALRVSTESDFVLLSFHPETLIDIDDGKIANNILLALHDALGDEYPIVIIGPNMDDGYRNILTVYDRLRKQKSNIIFYESIQSNLYLSAMSHCRFMIGNSSSGVIESSFLGTQVINVGRRQEGRPTDINVQTCDVSVSSIKDAICTTLNLEKSGGELELQHPYGQPGAANKILEILSRTEFSTLNHKPFFDLPSFVQE